LARLATGQHGVAARRQLVGLGFGGDAIKARCAAGSLDPIHREVFAVGHRRLTHRSYWWAAVLAYGDEALLSHRSAAALWGLSRRRAGPIHVTAPTGRQGVDRRTGIWIHRCRLHPEDRVLHDGLPVTSVARTLFDMAEVVDEASLRGAFEEADRLKILRLKSLERVCARGRGRRALRPIRRILPRLQVPVDSRSQLEARFIAFCESQGIPLPATNVLVLGDEVDALWPAASLIVELDSWEFHSGREAFQKDRIRDSAHLVAGYRTVRVTDWRLKHDARTLAAEIRALLGSAGR
jgi:hypothetical protein